MTVVVAGGLLLAGCTSTKSGKPSDPGGPTGSSGAPGSSGSSSMSSSASTGKLTKTFDPPLVFDKQPVAELPAGALGTSTDGINNYSRSMLDGTILYTVTDDTVSAIDVETGQPRWNVHPDGIDAKDSKDAAPILVDGKVYAVFESTIPGKGTTSAQDAITAVVVDAASGQATVTMQVPTPDAESGSALSDKGPTAVFGVSNDLIAVNRGNSTFVLDASTKSIAWQRKGFITRDVRDDMVIGLNREPKPDRGLDEVIGLRIADGKQAWAVPEEPPVSVFPAAPHLVLVNTDKSVFFLSTSNGAVRSKLTQSGGTALLGGTWCGYDERSMIVCKGEDDLYGIDPNAPGKRKWTIKAGSGREIPEISAVFHGAIYGKTSNGPVVVDAVTGADRPDSPVLVPTLVNEHVGIGKGEDDSGMETIGAFAPVK
jgi:outer membrane protein assembly factor BamB